MRPHDGQASLEIVASFLDERTVRVTVAGVADLATEAELGRALLAIVASKPLAGLEVDLRQVSFLDSCGIRALVQARNAAVNVGCAMWLTNPTPIVRKVLEITGLDRVFSRPHAMTASAP